MGLPKVYMTDSKKRISSLAKSYEISGDLLVKLLRDAGVEAKSAMSMIDQESFLKAKPLILAEKEKLDKEALIKAGKKIPMKAVIKKAPPVVAAPIIPKAEIKSVSAPREIIPEFITPVRAVVAPVVEAPVFKAPERIIEKAPEKAPEVFAEKIEAPKEKLSTTIIVKPTVVPKPEVQATTTVSESTPIPQATPVAHVAPVSPVSSVAPVIVAPVAAVVESNSHRPPSNELKVSVEKPDANLLARIARSQNEASRFRGRPDNKGQGYSGNLSRGPGGQGGPSNYGGGQGGTGNYGGQGSSGGGYNRPGGPGGAGGQGGGGYGNRPAGSNYGGQGGQGGSGGGYNRPGGSGGPGGAGGQGGGGYGNRPSAPGGGGNFGSQGGYGNRPGGFGNRPSNDGPRDVFAQRAQEAGIASVLSGITPKPDRHLDKDRADKDKVFAAGAPQNRSRGGHKKKTKEQIEAELLEARNNVNKVMASLSKTGKGKSKGRDKEEELAEGQEKPILQVGEFISIGELAGLMNRMPNQVIAKCMEMGMMVTINQRLDHETIALIADECGYQAELMDEYAEENFTTEEEDLAGNLIPRAPIITVMGHVDHGKTSILDYIRKTNVIAGESGGITQHVGAYMVSTANGPVCFLDTPGHEAFSAMRSRGVTLTDVVLLVVAADSMVMPQTKEAITLAKNANCQIVVAINKMDLPNANADKIRAQLAEAGVEVEQWGGKYPCVEVSARQGLNMDKLLETLALETEILDLKANPNRPAQATVIESRLDKGKGAVATILVQNGTLRVGDPFVTGIFSGKVRSILDERGNPREAAGPSTPCQILGVDGAPQAGDSFVVVADEREAREIANRRRMAAKDRELRQKRHITLDQLYDQIKSGEFHDLKVIIKADVDGSVEAIASALEKLSTKEVRVNVISKGVGAVKDADIHLAAASEALVIAFHVLPTEAVRSLAEREGVTINSYRIIYEIVDEIKAAMEGLLTPEIKEEVAGEAEILKVFNIPKVGLIAGCRVQSGSVERELKVRLYRSGIEVGEAKVTSLKREKDDARSVRSGFECGIGIEGLKDIREGDILAFFKKVEVARKLTAPLSA